MVLVVTSVALLMIAVERVAAARRLPFSIGFWMRALLASGFQAAVAHTCSPYFDALLSAHRPWSASKLGVLSGALVGYLALTFVYYVWHRARHEVPWLWRCLHQLHHSPSRIEVVTSFYKHPLEILANSVLSSFVLCVVIGLETPAITIAVLLTGLAELFYHWNVRTPHWLGYFIQRPESHRVHHERGAHRNNYSDLPLWDMLFGTFDNPLEDEAACGFEPEQEGRIRDMLLVRDVLAEGKAS